MNNGANETRNTYLKSAEQVDISYSRVQIRQGFLGWLSAS
jgi:hypothetical protein